jgi:hypothetical protein
MQKNCQLVTARLAKCYLIVNSEKSSKSAFLAFIKQINSLSPADICGYWSDSTLKNQD